MKKFAIAGIALVIAGSTAIYAQHNRSSFYHERSRIPRIPAIPWRACAIAPTPWRPRRRR
jgi:hypothetical protein